MGYSTPMGEMMLINIPRILMRKAHLDRGSFDFEVRSDGLLIKAQEHPRAGWAQYYKESAQEEHVWADIEGEFDEEEWQWSEK